MSDKISIIGHDIMKTQIGALEYKISVFQMDKPQLQFNVSLQLTRKTMYCRLISSRSNHR